MTGSLLTVIHNFAGGQIQVTSPVVIDHTGAGTTITSGIAFQTDGGLDDIGPGAATFNGVVSGEYWSEEPESGIGSSYDVRCASISIGTWGTQAASVGTWVTITEVRKWSVVVLFMDAPTDKDVTAIFEIRKQGGGAALATFTVIVGAHN